MKALIVPFLFLTACGAGPKHVDPALLPYFQRFETLTGVATAGVSGSIETVPAVRIGECYNGAVRIDTAYWDKATDDQREETVFHELGHCAMGLRHVGKVDGICPVSIMYPLEFGLSACYSVYKEHYAAELVLEYKSHK